MTLTQSAIDRVVKAVRRPIGAEAYDIHGLRHYAARIAAQIEQTP